MTDMTSLISALNAACFGRKDTYSDPNILKGKKSMTVMNGKRLESYLLYTELPEYLSIERLGTVKDKRRAGQARRLLARLKRLAKRLNKPIRTYISYDNLPSYLLHLKSGFYPTHVAWNRWVWVEYSPKGK